MHWRFFKRFSVSVLLLLVGGIFLTLRFTHENDGIKASTIINGESRQLHMKRSSGDDLLQTTFGESKTVQFTKHGWLLDVLAKNLSKNDAVEELLKELDKHMPNTLKNNDDGAILVTEKPVPVTEVITTQPVVFPTEGPKPVIHTQKIRKKRKPPDVVFAGFMNVHVWEAWCGNTVEDLRHNIHFPLYPDFRTTTDDLYIKQRQTDYGQRIFGYLHPPASGYYTFCLSSDDNSELWLSNSSDPKYLRKIAHVGNFTHPETAPVAEFHQFFGQISPRIHLVNGRKYFMEILHKQSGFLEHVLVAWKGPGISRIKMITNQYLSAYMDEDELDDDVNLLAEYVPETFASYPNHRHGSVEINHLREERTSKFGTNDLRKHFHMTPFINKSETEGLLPTCKYNPSYVVDFEVNRYEGVHLIHETAVYPDDQTELTYMLESTDCNRRTIDSHFNPLWTTPHPETSEVDVESVTINNDTVKAETQKNGTYLTSLVSNLKKRFANLKEYVNSYKQTFQGIRNSEPAAWDDWINSAKTGNDKHSNFQDNIVRNGEEGNNHNNVKLKMDSSFAVSHKGKQIPANGVPRVSRGGSGGLGKHNAVKNIQKDFKREKRKDNKKFLLLNKHGRKKQTIDRSHIKIIRRKNSKHSAVRKHIKNKNKHESVFDGETKINQRRLLEYETSNGTSKVESDIGSRSRGSFAKTPMFVPISRTEELQKRRFWPLVTRAPFRFRTFNDDERDDTFEMKAAYKKFNIKSYRDLLRFIRIYGYTSYLLLQETPRGNGFKFRQSISECKSDGNIILSSVVAESVVAQYMQLLKKRHGNKYSLKKIVNIEENHDVVNGDRYLIELDLKIKGYGDKSFRLSRYVYQNIGSLDLCEPIGFQWNPHADVHVIVPVKDQGRWVQHFIDNMEKIYMETLDTHFTVIIVDFNSTDIDIESSLQKSKLQRYKLIKMDGPFQRALGIQAGVDSIKNPHDIIFTCDLHLDIPSSLIDNIRKHCVEGKMAFAPIVVRLDCGYTPVNPKGLWETQGYGLFAITKSDFDRAGGMNTKEFKTKWGGEDWEMLDRMLSYGIEVERLRVPNFYHYFHTKKRMWTQSDRMS